MELTSDNLATTTIDLPNKEAWAEMQRQLLSTGWRDEAYRNELRRLWALRQKLQRTIDG